MTRITAALIAALTIVAPGCTDQGGTSTNSAPTARPPSNSNIQIPSNARRIAESTGSRLIHRPLRDGTIYVQDRTAGRVIYTGPVHAGDNVVVDPRADALAVNDIQVKHDVKLNPDHGYRLYFVQR